MQLQLDAVLRKRDNVVSRSLEDARIVLRLDRAETLVFNGAANAVWDLFDSVHTLREIAAESGLASEQVVAFAEELLRMELFQVVEAPAPAVARACAVVTRRLTANELPQLVAKEELAVLGGCTSASVACLTPSSTLGNGNGNGNPSGPPKPPPGRNK